MGKVNLEFDSIKERTSIQELSVVIYTDSFFYGLWDENDCLAKAAYHPLKSISNVLKLCEYNYPIKSTKVLSAIKPYVHLRSSDFQDPHFDVYFKGLYNLERVRTYIPTQDEFKHSNISTLHFINNSAINALKEFQFEFKSNHISTALANYNMSEGKKLVCYIANNKLHISLVDKSGYRLYNQFDCYYDNDYLYFLMLICSEFNLNPKKDEVNLGGEIDLDSSLYLLLKNYLRKINFVDVNIKGQDNLPFAHNHYYDLYLCKSCV